MKKQVLILLFVLLSINESAFAKEYLLLITGCGRSGTQYISRVLTKAGLDLPHEKLGKHGSVSWYRAGGGYYLYGTNAKRAAKNETYRHIFHQVRHPLKNIASCQTFSPNSWEYIYAGVKEITPNDPLIVRCAKYWYYWNLKTEKIAEWTYRIEDIENCFGELSKRLGRSLDKSSLKKVSKSTNSRKSNYQPITWEQLKKAISPTLYSDIIALAKKYGYDVPTS